MTEPIALIGNSPGLTLEVLTRLEGSSISAPLWVFPGLAGSGGAGPRLKRTAAGVLGRLPIPDRLARPMLIRLVQRATRSGARVLFPDHAASPAVVRACARLGIRRAVVAGLNQILKPEHIDALPPLWNVHPSKLPARRGPIPTFWSLAKGDKEGGVTIHELTPEIDAGPIVGQRTFPIPDWYWREDLNATCAHHAVELLGALLDGAEPPEPNGEEPSYQRTPAAKRRWVRPDSTADDVWANARAWGRSDPMKMRCASVPVPDRPVELIEPDADAGAEVAVHIRHPVADTSGTPGTITRTAGDGIVLHLAGGSLWGRVAG